MDEEEQQDVYGPSLPQDSTSMLDPSLRERVAVNESRVQHVPETCTAERRI